MVSRTGTIYQHRLNKRVGSSCSINDHIRESLQKEMEVMKVKATKIPTLVRVGGNNGKFRYSSEIILVVT